MRFKSEKALEQKNKWQVWCLIIDTGCVKRCETILTVTNAFWSNCCSFSRSWYMNHRAYRVWELIFYRGFQKKEKECLLYLPSVKDQSLSWEDLTLPSYFCQPKSHGVKWTWNLIYYGFSHSSLNAKNINSFHRFLYPHFFQINNQTIKSSNCC